MARVQGRAGRRTQVPVRVRAKGGREASCGGESTFSYACRVGGFPARVRVGLGLGQG